MINLNGKVFKYAGPPGTGKTTALLGIVERYLAAGCDPEDILYTTFTRAGAYEARDRAVQRFNLPPARFPYFRTIHSLCYQELGKGEVMAPADWCAIARMLGMSFTLHWGPSEGVPRGSTRGDHLVALWSLARVRMEPLEKVYRDRDLHALGSADLGFQELEQFVGVVSQYKETFGKIDYTDMLEKFLLEDQALPCRYAIIDEAQDLSILQWRVLEKVCREAKEVHVAGDDDQCIHEWNGAMPALFIDLPSADYQVLPQSFRIPATVHALAARVIEQVQGRLPKQFAPREEPGIVERVASIADLDMSKGTWLVLARNNCYLEAAAKALALKGVLFSGYGEDDIPKILGAIKTWKRLTEGFSEMGRGMTITAAEAKAMYGFMSQRDRVTRGFKTKLATVDDSRQLAYEDLRTDWGLVADANLSWDRALDLVSEERRSYLLAVERSEGLGSRARVELSTIHGAKGREADHVLLISDMTFRSWSSLQTSPDQEHRVWYVGVTRARKSLHILQPTQDTHYPL